MDLTGNIGWQGHGVNGWTTDKRMGFAIRLSVAYPLTPYPIVELMNGGLIDHADNPRH